MGSGRWDQLEIHHRSWKRQARVRGLRKDKSGSEERQRPGVGTALSSGQARPGLPYLTSQVKRGQCEPGSEQACGTGASLASADPSSLALGDTAPSSKDFSVFAWAQGTRRPQGSSVTFFLCYQLDP